MKKFSEDTKNEAVRLFESGFNCAQAILVAYGAEFGLQREEAVRLGAAFGGGLVGTGSVCGAVTGALMVIGLRHGEGGMLGKLIGSGAERKGQKFLKRFTERAGSLQCAELLDTREGYGCAGSHKEQCATFVLQAGEILEEIL